MTTLIEHYEKHLGRWNGSWTKGPDGEDVPATIHAFEVGSIQGAIALASDGLSRTLLPIVSGRHIRVEIMMLLYEEFGYRNAPAILQQVLHEAIRKHRALVQGDVLGPRGPLLRGTKMEAIYATSPFYFPSAFEVFEPAGLGPVNITWLIPVLREEGKFIQEQGWEAFEELIATKEPDLVDMERPSLVSA